MPDCRRLMSRIWLTSRSMRLLDAEMCWRSSVVRVSLEDSRAAAMEIDCNGLRRSWPSTAIRRWRMRSTSAAWLRHSSIRSRRSFSAIARSVSLQGVEWPRTTSSQASNEPRGVSRGPEGPMVNSFSGLPPQRMRCTSSWRNQKIQPDSWRWKRIASTPQQSPPSGESSLGCGQLSVW